MAYVAIEQNESTIGEDYLLPTKEIGQLYLIAQVGAKGSLNSLRDFLGVNSDILVNCLSILPTPILIERIFLYYQNHIGFHLRFSGEISGEIYTFLREEHALAIIEKLLGQKLNQRRRMIKDSREHHKFNRIEISVLAELVNIITNSFWRALSEKTTFNWWITPPVHVSDLNRSVAYTSKIHALEPMVIHLEYLIPILEIRVQFIILPTENTLKRIIGKLGLSNYGSEGKGQVLATDSSNI